MDKKISSFLVNRRQFLANILPAGTLFCLGCGNLLALPQAKEKPQTSSDIHKFKAKSGMTFEQVFRFAFQGYISKMQVLVNDIGKDKFIEMLKNASSEAAAQSVKKAIQNLPINDLATFIAMMENNPFYKQVLTYNIVEKTDNAVEIRVTECLWAKTFRQASEPDAVDIGYASICYPDYAMASAFNPKMKMIRNKTLMQGHDCCNHRYVWEG